MLLGLKIFFFHVVFCLFGGRGVVEGESNLYFVLKNCH